MNPAFEVEFDGGRRYLVNDREGLRLNLTETVSQAIDATTNQLADTAGQRCKDASPDVVDYLRRLRVLVEPDYVLTAAEGICQASVAPIGTSWVQELRDLARWVVVGCGAAFNPTDFGNPASGMLPVRRGLQNLLRPDRLWSYDTRTHLGVGSALVLDFGDIIYQPSADRAGDVHDRLRFASRQIVEFGGKPLLIGGDHSLTHPVVTALAQSIPGLRLVHFDAHADRRPLEEGPNSAATPDCGNFVEHLLSQFPDLPILTIGVRGWTENPMAIASHHQYVTAADVIAGRGAAQVNKFCGGHPIYITTDIDVLDPCIAPEVAYASPAGLTLPHLQELIAIATRSAAAVVGADFVEACDWNTGRNLAAMAQVCAIAALLDNDCVRNDTRRSATGFP